MRRVLAVAVVAVSALVATPAAAKPKISHATVTVVGTNDEWTDTKITVAPGDIVLATVTGKMKVGEFHGEVGPNGTDRGLGRLVFKVGTGGPVPVGQKLFVTVEEPGALKFKVHDTKYSDNAGSFTVDLVILPAGTIPEPVAVAAQ